MEPPKSLDYCLITCVTHNSRISDRMVHYIPTDYLKGLKSVVLTKSQQKYLALLICEKVFLLKLRLITFNILPDHIHLLLGISDLNNFENRVGQLKGYTSYQFKKKFVLNSGLWAQKFNRKWIVTDKGLRKVYQYVHNNHIKHESSWGKQMLCGFDEDFQNTRKRNCFNPWV